ncbi:MAG: hypothetical protein J6M38_10485 [Lentisphaeria bacterium]|nr:hypothetical protein [Lentisphaeria bacterium]
MITTIEYTDKQKCFAYDWNRTMKQVGLEIYVSNGRISLAPVTTKNPSTSCIPEIPMEDQVLEKLIEVLNYQKVKKHD